MRPQKCSIPSPNSKATAKWSGTVLSDNLFCSFQAVKHQLIPIVVLQFHMKQACFKGKNLYIYIYICLLLYTVYYCCILSELLRRSSAAFEPEIVRKHKLGSAWYCACHSEIIRHDPSCACASVPQMMPVFSCPWYVHVRNAMPFCAVPQESSHGWSEESTECFCEHVSCLVQSLILLACFMEFTVPLWMLISM